MWPFTPFGGEQRVGNHTYTLDIEAPEGAISRPMFYLGSWFLGGETGQDPNAERAPLI